EHPELAYFCTAACKVKCEEWTLLPCSGLRLRMLPELSIGVFPKDTELHVLLKPGRRNWLLTNHLEGCSSAASPCGCPHP
ncbi:hypothetical protein KUCAC02_012471, partial [Chaenocephalus aceratus]